ncbi:hypothetical protein LTR37_011451 [Vermiconidia calcicola]|uniref:Uncharacterized protein n=1 Tax=Vermiconidia calcicola TaxID=1690605 RepID=A0ACC3N209_9PEZI|nr:hypothetical protein LTR37_011451 [Vermiconidia calcicola]
MSGAVIEPPYTIASLPKPLDRILGRVQTAPVYGIRGSRKRKRHEIAVGIDGEGVNVYNVQSQRLVASYAVSPQTYICCAPCSVYIRATTVSTPAQRKTYIVTKDSADDRKLKLICFAESVGRNKDANSEFAAPKRTECTLDVGDIVSLDAVPLPQHDHLFVVATYTTGNISTISSDLSTVEKQDPRDDDSSNDTVVEYSTFVDPESARRGILKSREDVTAALDQNAPGSPVLRCNMIRTGTERRLQLYSIKPPTQHTIQTLRSGMQLLMSYELPTHRKHRMSDAQYELHAANGTLYQLLDSRLSIYDLSGTTPKLSTELGAKLEPISSFARVSATSVLTASRNQVTLYETKYGSAQGSVNLSTDTGIGQSKKRQREEVEDQGGSFNLLSCFPESGLSVALYGNDLVALQLSEAIHGKKRAKSHGTVLADVIGKGSTGKMSEKKKRKWEEWTTKVDALVESDDITGLEKLVANDPKLGEQRAIESAHDPEQTSELPNGDRVAYEDLWPLPETFDPSNVDQHKVLYILGKVFAHADSGDGSLDVLIPSIKLLEWLALVGTLNVDSLRKAYPEGTDVRSGDVMAAVRRIDDDLQLTHDLLSLPVYWEAEEVIQALRMLVLSFDDPEAETSLLTLPAPPQLNGDTEMTNGDADSDLELESKAAEQELEHAMTALSSGLEVRSDTLGVIFARLHTFDQHIITSKMRAMMSHRELIFFIHVLRIELADGGWTSKYIDVGEDDEDIGAKGMVNTIGGAEESGPSNEAIRTISDLLNCAVDAIGISGWLVGLSGAPVSAELLASLRAEVSAGLEGCYEADTLGTVVADIERFAASVEKSQLPGRRFMEGEGDGIDVENAMLPMGRVDSFAVRGQGKKKSKMLLAQEKSRRVGKYSFERIRI